MNAYEKRYYSEMTKEMQCVRDLMVEVEGKMIDQDYDTAIKRCYDLIRSLETMKKIHTEKQFLDELVSAGFRVLGGVER
ncbi:hypothetical protein [Aeribacillus composti]|uniref:hypothetical protein n=1 Tax=Aeribacillus composti TaxID=1868734 RepID=UPI002E20D760|nr:hypothetical protein [Aeribacillus composti]